MNKVNDPTYIIKDIKANPVWDLAWTLSEIIEDDAPIGWGKYIYVAQMLLVKYDIKNKLKGK